MKVQALIAALVAAAFLMAPAAAGTKSMKNTSTAGTNCKAMLKAKKVSKADWQTELGKCMDNPSTYQ
jgi:hypothetical protein